MSTEEMKNIAKTFLESLTVTSNSLRQMVFQVSNNMRETMNNQQKDFSQQLDQINKIVENNRKMMESYQKMAEKVVCLDEERNRREGKYLYSMVHELKKSLDTKYGLDQNGNSADGMMPLTSINNVQQNLLQ